MANGKPAPGRRVIDLDQARKARAEKHGEPITIIFGGEEFTLPPEMPFEFAHYASEGVLRPALEALMGDQADAFFAHRPTLQDYEELAEQVSDLYGASLGDSSASPGS